MSSAAYAKFTFFEAATQHGWVLALMAPHMHRSLHTHRIIVDDERGRVFQLFKASNPEVPVWEYVIPDRSTKESTLMWRAKVEREIEKSWNAFKNPPPVASGEAVTEPSPSTPSSPESSSPGAPPASEISPTESEVVAPVSPEPAPSPQKRPSSKPKGTSSKGSKKASPVKA